MWAVYLNDLMEIKPSLFSSQCLPNVCTCENGQETNICVNHGDESCIECDEGYQLEGAFCNPIPEFEEVKSVSCSCPNGEPADNCLRFGNVDSKES